MACTQNQCISCVNVFAMDSHNCRALIIYRQVKPAVVARNRKSLNKKHPVSMIFLNEDGVSSSRFLFFFSDLYLIIFIPLFEHSGKVETKYLVRDRCKFDFMVNRFLQNSVLSRAVFLFSHNYDKSFFLIVPNGRS